MRTPKKNAPRTLAQAHAVTTRRSTAAYRCLSALVILTILITACSFPALPTAKTPTVRVIQPTPIEPEGEPAGGNPQELSPTEAAAAQPTPLPNLPPALVEVNPLPGSEITPQTTPVISFNQPMERESVEAAIEFPAGQEGRLEWVDDTTLRLIPAAQSAAAGLDITIGEGARSASGLALPAPVRVQFSAAGPLRPAERLPAPDAKDVNPSSAVVVTFNRPVVALGETEAQPPAFTLEPSPPGRGEWINTSTYIFYPDPALLGGGRYTVRINPQLTTLEGISLDAAAGLEWSFSTSAPVVLSVEPAPGRAVPLDSPFTLTFNQQMDRPSVESAFSVTRGDGSLVEGTIQWNETGTELTFTPSVLLDRGATFSLLLSGEARSAGGAALGQNFAAVIPTMPQFAVVTTRPGAGELLEMFSGYGAVMLAFSSPVAAGQDLDSLISISPSVSGMNIARSYDGEQVFVNGYFQPATSYTLNIDPALRDRWEAQLGVPFTLAFSTPAAPPSLIVPSRVLGLMTTYVPANEPNIIGRGANLTGLSLQRGKLTLAQYIQADSSYEENKLNWQSLVDENWTSGLSQAEGVVEDIQIPLTPDWTPLDPGLYFLKVDSQPAVDDPSQPPLLLVVSPVQMVVKISDRQAFVWAIHAADSRAVTGVRVDIFDSSGTSLASCITDPDGKCQAALPLREDDYRPLYAVIGQPGEENFSVSASTWSQGIVSWDFQLPFDAQSSHPEVYLYTDRPIYQPGQMVNYRILARSKDNARYGPAPFPQLTVEVVGPYDPVTGQSRVLATQALPPDGYGAVHGVYTLPDDAPLGTYILRVQEEPFREIYFEVAEYRKPEIDLKVEFTSAEVLAGDDLQASVTARYFFGAPAGNIPLRWSLVRSRQWVSLPEGLSAGPVDLAWMDPFGGFGFSEMYVWDGETTIGPDGTAQITIPGDELRERLGEAGAMTQTLRLEVTTQDESGLPVSARASTRMHPSSYYIGLKPEEWNGQAGRETTFTVRSLEWNGSPIADKLLSARFSRVTWKRLEATGAEMPGYEMETTPVGSTDFRTSPNGDARLAFTPPDPGTYLLELSGEGGALTQRLIWVGGENAALWPELPNQRLRLTGDRTGENGAAGRYTPGETARIFIPNPFVDGALVLITVERGKVMRSSVMNITGSSYELELPLTTEDAPNVYVSVTLLGRSDGRLEFRIGYLELAVDPSSLLLDMSLQTSPEQPQPGDDVTLTLRVKDADGEPVQGAFSLALVDKAVLALRDPNSSPITEAFYGRQPLGVQTSASLIAYSGRIMVIPPGRGGGGGGDMAGVLPVRSRFEDTAYWNGALETDVTGIAQVTVQLPDNLTTWRADARGLTADARVGQAQAELVVGKPLLIAPVAPRFTTAGDHIELAAVVHNNTGGALRTSVRLESVGFTLDDVNQTAQAVEIPAGDRRRVSWRGTVQNVPALDLTFSVESDAAAGTPLRDAAQVASGKLPVLRYSSPQTFGTSGILDEAGERMEVIGLPRSFSPTGGELRLELSPSLTAAVLEGLAALDEYPSDFNEPVISRLLPNLATHEAMREYGLEDEALRVKLETAITSGVEKLTRAQNEDGGWGWAPGYRSDPYIATCALFGLSRAANAGAFVDPESIRKAQDYLRASFDMPSPELPDWMIDQQAFRFFVLQDSGLTDLNYMPLFDMRDKLSPWGKAFLAITIHVQSPGSEQARTLLSDLGASAVRTSTGASWRDPNPAHRSWSTTIFTTAVVAYAYARIDPASPLLADAVRYLMLNRYPGGAWSSSFDTSWALLALLEMIRGTGGVQADYSYSAALNGSPLIQGRSESAAQAVRPVTSALPLNNLRPSAPNALVIQRGDGQGRLFYRAFLRVDRPAEDAPPVQRGMSISRQYYMSGQDCRKTTCQPIGEASLANPQPVMVRLTLTVPEDMYYVIVEDTLPAGTEVLNPRLNTTLQQVVPVDENGNPLPPPLNYDPANPFGEGWGWWRFQNPQVYDDRVRWVVDNLPAGTYEITYRMTPYLAGEFRVLPARAWQYYFPEVEAASKGEIFVIR